MDKMAGKSVTEQDMDKTADTKHDTTRHGQDGRHKAWHNKTWTRWQTQSTTQQDMDKMADKKHDTTSFEDMDKMVLSVPW